MNKIQDVLNRGKWTRADAKMNKNQNVLNRGNEHVGERGIRSYRV